MFEGRIDSPVADGFRACISLEKPPRKADPTFMPVALNCINGISVMLNLPLQHGVLPLNRR